ncbi:MAG: PQQ-like beta-propeller repeat protein [Chloroflexi bacterium]|nr:PQQ-like beta-propeller repeat protein [Chloroflexota bacterium]
MQLFDPDGNLQWRFVRNTNPHYRHSPGDCGRFGRRRPSGHLPGQVQPRRFSQLVRLDTQGNLVWEQNISARLTTLTAIQFNGRHYIAAGTSRGEILVYNADGQRLWLRTLNKPITSLVAANLSGEPVLLAGTDSGTLVAYNADGRRLWTRNLDLAAIEAILNISTAPAAPMSNRCSRSF